MTFRRRQSDGRYGLINDLTDIVVDLHRFCSDSLFNFQKKPTSLHYSSLLMICPPTLRNHSASSITSTPCFWASLSLEPAPGPAIRRSVFFETDPATLAPSLSAMAFASSRVIFSSAPVKTTVLPETWLCLTAPSGVASPSASSLSKTSTLCC